MSELVLLSGGLDSMVLSEMSRLRGSLSMVCHITYLHPAAHHERSASFLYAQRTGIPFREVSLPIDGHPYMATGVAQPGPRVVPVRNAFMVMAAAHFAASAGLERVLFGASGEDSAEYADCRPEYVSHLNDLASPFGVTVEAPLLSMSRAEIREWARTTTPWVLDLAWSCYEPIGPLPCGHCNSCSQDAV